MNLTCVSSPSESRMFYVGKTYAAKHHHGRVYSVRDDYGHERVLVVDGGQARFIASQREDARGRHYPSIPAFAFFREQA